MFEVIKYDYDTKMNAIKALKGSYKETFVAEIAQVLKENKLQTFTWQQYTPYFCDGDICEFSVHEPDIYELFSNTELTKNDETVAYKAIRKIVDTICSKGFEDLMLLMFGDHKEITITSKAKCKVVLYTDHD